jgi:hypothetical protein
VNDLNGDQPQPQPQQIQLTPWSWAFQTIGDTPMGPLMAVMILRPPMEQIQLMAVVADHKRFHHDLGNAIRERESGLIVPAPGQRLPPPMP